MSHPPFVAHDPKHIDPQKDHPRRAVLTAVPDLRFEYGFLKSVRPYFRIRPTTTTVPESPEGTGKGKEKAPAREGEAATEVLEIQWLDVGWVTVRDQVLSPLVQGALWCVGRVLVKGTSYMKNGTGQSRHIFCRLSTRRRARSCHPRRRAVSQSGCAAGQSLSGSAMLLLRVYPCTPDHKLYNVQLPLRNFYLHPFVDPHVPRKKDVEPAEPNQLAWVLAHCLHRGPVLFYSGQEYRQNLGRRVSLWRGCDGYFQRAQQSRQLVLEEV